MYKKRLFRIIVLFGFILTSCYHWEIHPVRKPIEIKEELSFLLPVQPDRIVADNRSGTIYLLERERNLVHILKPEQRVNTIGGFGTEKTNFLKLMDIAVDTDGNLLTLDGFAKQIRKFSSLGVWITDWSINFLIQPERLAVTPEGDLIIYDAAPKELYRISAFDKRIIYSFGRFAIPSVSQISCSKDNISIINEEKTKTFIYSSLGQYVREIPYQVIFDQYQNRYEYRDGALWLADSDIKYPLGKSENTIYLSTDGVNLYLAYERRLSVLKPIFDKR